jgi:GH15 family glucan-1,4-alpha-glucosidase
VIERRRRAYAPIRDYAAIGDGRSVALVALNGSIDWLCLPAMDSPSVFGAILDSERGGSFALAPAIPYEARRQYLRDTNVLETTFSTADGVVRVTDAMTLPDGALAPYRELARRVEGVSGRVPIEWRVEPRFGYGLTETRMVRRGTVPVAEARTDALAVCSWDAGEARVEDGAVTGRYEAAEGAVSIVSLSAAAGEPLVFPARGDVERRLDDTERFWRRWADSRECDVPWRDAVLRSLLALKLLAFAPSGAVVAAPTTSLPERIGGERNWDYRYCWVRDSAFTIDAFLQTGCSAEAQAFLWWLLHASQLTHPRLNVLYRLDGGADADEKTLPLAGYRDSQPVRVGNAALEQLQLDIYGDLLQTAWLFAQRLGGLDADTSKRLSEIADHVCRVWREPDSGIWEARSEPRQYTHSKMMCWVALDRAATLAEEGLIRGGRPDRWRREADEIRSFVEDQCWSNASGSYVRYARGDELDASLLLAAVMGYSSTDDERLLRTIDSLRRELGHGPLLHRYRGEDGLSGEEGAFLACSFWLVDALARCGRVDEAGETMDELIGLANDVGLYAEEIDPASGDFLGNMPQGLVHLALVSAAFSVAEAQR